MGMLSDKVLKRELAKARAKWGFMVFLFCLAYVFFALAFISIRLWLWGSAHFWALILRLSARLQETPYGGLLPRSLRDPQERERIAQLIKEHRALLAKYGWFP